jgi:type I pantothenate kinase
MDVLRPAADAISALAQERAPVIVAIGGPVAVGKTTIAADLAAELSNISVRVLSTDAFLFANTALAARDLLMRKGFPESYDAEAIADVLGALRRGEPANVPVYSHAIYDIVPDELEVVEPADVVVVEGVIALQDEVRRYVDLGIYVDAPEGAIRGWFVDRFRRFTDAARGDATSFYHRFAKLEDEQIREIAEGTWDGINAVNLHEHIAPSKRNADLVVEKGPHHELVGVTEFRR